jgi:hypothetical protein
MRTALKETKQIEGTHSTSVDLNADLDGEKVGVAMMDSRKKPPRSLDMTLHAVRAILRHSFRSTLL